jgi:DNA-binding IclR family transcriptional regulator
MSQLLSAKTPKRRDDAKGENLSVRKAVRILRLFTGGREGLALKEIAEATGFPKSICHRLLATLVAERFVAQDTITGRYRFGPDLVAYARIGLGHSEWRDAALPELIALAKETGDVALLHMLDHGSALCLDREDGDYPVRTAGVQIGGRLPLHCGGGPFAILSFAPTEIVDTTLSQPLAAFTARTVVDPVRIRRRVIEVRTRGYAVGDQDAFDYVVAVGAPIFDAHAELVGALSVGGIKPRYKADRIALVGRMVQAAAFRVSERLGYRRPKEVRAVAR